MADVNFVSFEGNGTRQVIRKYWNEAGGGVELFPHDELFGQMRDIIIPELVVPPGVRISDVFKASRIRDVRFSIGRLAGTGAEEDAADLMTCRNLEFLIDDLWAATLFCFTIKGESNSIRVQAKRQHTHGRETDYDLGNIVDRNLPQGRTTNCNFNIVTVDRSPVRIRVLNAHTPTLENPSEQAYKISDGAKGFFASLIRFLQSIFGRRK